MKAFAISLIALFCLVGCDNTPVDKKGRYVAEKPNEWYSDIGKLSYIVFDGHEYVRLNDGHQGGLCHSPKCKCLEEKK